MNLQSIFLSTILLSPFLTFASESYITGFSLEPLSSKSIYEPTGNWQKLSNTSTSKYFIPTRSHAEWTAFISNLPTGVTRSNTNPKSCLEIKNKNPNSISNIYNIDPEEDGTTTSVFCDMQTDGGGWTLIARTAVVGIATNEDRGKFGWNFTTGTLTDFSNPYSFGVGNAPLPFTEVLVGQRTPASNLPGYHILKRPFSRDSMIASSDAMFYGGTGTWIQNINRSKT